MVLRRSCVLALMVGVAAASLVGCEFSSQSAWKSTKSLYSEYLNPPASIDYGDKGSLSDAEAALAIRMRGIDRQLTRLERRMENADRAPSPQMVSQLFGEFPWLSGFAAVDAASGTVLVQEPPMGLKQLDFQPLLEQKGRGNRDRALRALVQDTPLGPEVLVGVPVYNSLDLMGLVIVHFDLRGLVPTGVQPEEMVVLAPEAVLWSGRFDIASTPLAGRDWRALTRSQTSGTVSSDNGQFLWMARFIGTEPLIFAVPVSGRFVENLDGAEGVTRGSFVGVPASAVPVIESESGQGGPNILHTPAPAAIPTAVDEKPIAN